MMDDTAIILALIAAFLAGAVTASAFIRTR